MPLSTREEKELRALHRRKEREARGRFLAEGVRVVEDLLASPLEVHLLAHLSSLEDDSRGSGILGAAARRGVPIRSLEPAEFGSVAQTESPQGVLAIASAPRWSLEALLPRSARDVVLVLDGVQDPGNVGTLIRTAEALGARGVVCAPGTADAWNSKAVRAAAGSSFRLPIHPARWEDLTEWFPRAGYEVLLSEVGGAAVAPATRATALMVGNEGSGASEQARLIAGRRVGIPLRGPAESLNVNAAAAILLYELLR